MNQLTWTYIADNGDKHIIGLAHGPKTGHFLVHCNSKVSIVDFNVFESNSYSLFIDEQLCEIQITRLAPQQFSYDFKINNKADTPRNRARNKIEKKHLYQSLAFLGTLFLIVTGFLILSRSFNNKQHIASHLTSNMITTVGRVLEDRTDDELTYYFSANGVPQQFTIRPEDYKMPIEKGDEFTIKYQGNNPSVHIVDFKKPTPNQIERYQKRLTDKLDELNVSYGAHFVCVFNQLYLLKGLDGINDLYFQNISPAINSEHNQETYAQLMKEKAVQEILNNCN